jgi:hypothetical protein
MAEIKNQFFRAKMNKDVDPKVMSNLEYLDALNVKVRKSNGESLGSLENIQGNVLAYTDFIGQPNCDCIGVYVDEKNNRIYWAVTNFYLQTSTPQAKYGDYCAILMYDQNASNMIELVSGHFLNFSKTHLLTFSIIDNLLFFSDNLNQPRKIDINYALSNQGNIKTEDQIVVTRFCPYLAPLFFQNGDTSISGIKDYLNTSSISYFDDTTITSSYLKERFVRFSYRFKFIDNEYSTIAPFSQIAFIPKEKITSGKEYKKIYKTTQLENMTNQSKQVFMSINLPSSNVNKHNLIVGIEILIKESDSTLVKVVEYIDLTNHSHDTLNYEYRSTVPYKVLPSDQILRIFDNLPIKNKAQEVAGNRIMYGNYISTYNLPTLNYTVGFDSKPTEIITEYRNHTIKQNRNYQVGIVLADREGRKSPVILSENIHDSHFFVRPQPDNTADFKGYCLFLQTSNPIPNPYATRYIADIHGGDWNVNNDNTITVLGSDVTSLNTNYGTVDIVGFYLVGQEIDYVEILKIEFDGTNSTIYTSDLANNDTYHHQDNGPLFKIDKRGWYSYEVVVKQKEQEFYNVYTAGVINKNGKTWITLAGDNINKIPRDLTLTQQKDSIYRTSTILYPKVMAIANAASSTPWRGPHQYSGVGLATSQINPISIGTAYEEGLHDIGSQDVWAVIYENDKNHLVVELSDQDIVYGMAFTTLSTSVALTEEPDSGVYGNAKMQLSVFETKPIESELDLFWETSTTGLIEELNYSIQSQVDGSGNTGIIDILTDDYDTANGCRFFREDVTEGDTIGTLFCTGGTAPYTYQLLNARSDDNTSLTNLITISSDKVITHKRFAYKSNNPIYVAQNTVILTIKATDSNGSTFTKDLIFVTRNMDPYSYAPYPCFQYKYTINDFYTLAQQASNNGFPAGGIYLYARNGSSLSSALSTTGPENRYGITYTNDSINIKRYPETALTPSNPEFVIDNSVIPPSVKLVRMPANDVELFRIQIKSKDALGGIGSLNESNDFAATFFVRALNTGNSYKAYNILTIEKPMLVREFDGFDATSNNWFNQENTPLSAGGTIQDFGLGNGSSTKALYTYWCQDFKLYMRQNVHSIDDYVDPSAPIGLVGSPLGTVVSDWPILGNTSSTYNTVIGHLTAGSGNTLYDVSNTSVGVIPCYFLHLGYAPVNTSIKYRIIAEWNLTEGLIKKMHYVRY